MLHGKKSNEVSQLKKPLMTSLIIISFLWGKRIIKLFMVDNSRVLVCLLDVELFKRNRM